MKLWGGRFQKEECKLMEDFNSSLPVDKRLFKEDILGSMAHVRMLAKVGIVTVDEGQAILHGLGAILAEIESGQLAIEGEYEDIHSFIEIQLVARVGDLGKKLHTARSRNDQVAVDTKMYARTCGMRIIAKVQRLQAVMRETGEKHNTIMPGYTHLQRAQVVTWKHHLLAYVEMLERDKCRFTNAIELLNESPLGCCALAGTTYEIDRECTAQELDFRRPVGNYLDGVSDRDYLIEMISNCAILMMHLSRLSEELIIWSSQEFRFVEIDDTFTTGSSIMPQKKNPDAAELIRGKTGRVYGSLMALLTTMKGLPLAYNKDMQEDKEQFFDATDTVLACLEVMAGMLSTMRVNRDKMLAAVKKGFLNATEVADYLVGKGVPFRDAHRIAGEIVLFCEKKGLAIEELELDEFRQFSDLFQEDVFAWIAYEQILEKGIKGMM